jgi:hypothetical protein
LTATKFLQVFTDNRFQPLPQLRLLSTVISPCTSHMLQKNLLSLRVGKMRRQCDEDELVGLIRISEFCMHVYQRLHLAYTCYCERATDVGFKKGKNTTFTACFSLEMLEKLIMYDA